MALAEPVNNKSPGVLSDKRRAEALLVAVTVVWGLTFALTKKSITPLGPLQPFVFMAWRFWLAFIVMAVFCARRMGDIDRGMFRASLLLGILLYASYAFQTFGLKYTSAGNAGFVTGLYVVFVPVLSYILLKQKPEPRAVASVLVALAGLAVLSVQSNFRVNFGDYLVLACAFCYSVHILLLDRYVKKYDLALLTMLQMGFLAFSNTASGLIFETFKPPGTAFVWMSIIICGLFASAAAFYIQGLAQRTLTPVRTSLVLIMEPVFSVIFGIIILGEVLTWRTWLGCGLILAGMLLTEIPDYRSLLKREKKGPEEAEA